MQNTSILILVILCILMGYKLLASFFNKDKSLIWSPFTPIIITLIYYVVVPSFSRETYFGRLNVEYEWLFYLSVLVFYVGILIAFRFTKSVKSYKWNTYFDDSNVAISAVLLFIIAVAMYAPFRGFRVTIDAKDVTIMAERTGFVQYFIEMISILVGASCLALIRVRLQKGISIKYRVVLYTILYFTLVFFIVGGFRYRIVILLLALGSVYHLFPMPRRINFVLWGPLALATYLFFAVMDTAREYGAGLNMEEAHEVSLTVASKGAAENKSVMDYSILVTDYYKRNGGYIGITPVVNAILFPIPRTLFPWKPNAEYLKEAQSKTLGDGYGAAMLCITEAYISFGIIGVLLYGLLFGWACKKVWSNYRNNKDSIGAILLLSLFNGFLYMWISRGYMSAAFFAFIYYVVLPFLLTRLVFNKVLHFK